MQDESHNDHGCEEDIERNANREACHDEDNLVIFLPRSMAGSEDTGYCVSDVSQKHRHWLTEDTYTYQWR